jgi:26S proteasome non-ATPase regulatory subunit 9
MDTRKVLEDLMLKKTKIEEDIKEQGEILDAEGHVGMTEKLVDNEGFPRNDIDLYRVRAARQRIICLQNDYKVLMDQIEMKLNEYHGEQRSQDKVQDIKTSFVHKPFLKVSQVDSGSPAHDCGIQVDDEIIQFGPYIAANTDKKLTQIAELVKKSEDKIILLNALRPVKLGANEETKELVRIRLVPKKWSGHGLLGCKIVPI